MAMRDGQLIRPEGRISTIAEINEARANMVPQDLGYNEPPRRTWEDGGPSVPESSEIPVAAFSVVVEGLDVSVDASPSFDPEEYELVYTWDFGDESEQVDGVTAEHTYAEDGTYDIVLLVEDVSGETADLTISVTVAEPVEA